ncbi:ATP-binding cassette ABC transporter [Rhodotorula toruloides]|uniref:ATP-binding cassette ABC transporter n=1 Tax=Rhodotorula toruloides TaxID=5286 RepID=A0A511KKK6_RHOTO|nr:ATP-binding cassette ABC transporter [Rhodotorula toruloides]
MGNVRLLFWGVLLGLLSALYPRLPLYFPSLSGRLPFLPTEHRDLLASPSGKLWADTLHRYQASVPVSPNHEHSKQAEWEAELERQLRFGSKEGGKELEKEYKRQLREVERRAEHAGAENLVKEVLPVYFVEHGEDVDPSVLASVGAEINSLQPQTIILLAPHETFASRLLVSTASTVSTISSTYSPAIAFTGSPRVASQLIRAFAHTPPLGVPAAGSTLQTLSPRSARVLSAMHLDSEVELVQVLLPVMQEKEARWGAEKWSDAGRAIHDYLHEKEKDTQQVVGVGKHRREYKNVVVIALGSAAPKNPSSSFPALLSSALAHHTSHARELSLHSLYSSSSGSKPQKAVRGQIVGLYTAVAAAGEGEGEMLGRGEVWRLGHLPIR